MEKLIDHFIEMEEVYTNQKKYRHREITNVMYDYNHWIEVKFQKMEELEKASPTNFVKVNRLKREIEAITKTLIELDTIRMSLYNLKTHGSK